MKIINYLLLSFLFTSCTGRIDDRVANNLVKDKIALTENKPTIVVFSAVWCKPCKAEIGDLNRISNLYGDKISIVNYIVEGSEKNTAPTFEEINNSYKDQTGEVPNYKMLLDEKWKVYDSLSFQNYHQLPSIIILDNQKNVALKIQRSLDYETELRPVIERLISNTPIENPQTEPDIDSPTKVMTLLDWISFDGYGESSVITTNLKKAWIKGRSIYGFTSIKMPFLSGEISYLVRQNNFLPKEIIWISDSEDGLCKMNVRIDAQGNYISSSGICN